MLQATIGSKVSGIAGLLNLTPSLSSLHELPPPTILVEDTLVGVWQANSDLRSQSLLHLMHVAPYRTLPNNRDNRALTFKSEGLVLVTPLFSSP